jgi:hypothetical protein
LLLLLFYPLPFLTLALPPPQLSLPKRTRCQSCINSVTHTSLSFCCCLLACCLNHYQSFPLSPSPLPHAHSSSSVTAAETDLPPVSPCLTSSRQATTHFRSLNCCCSNCCDAVSHQPSDPLIYLILLLACCSNHCQSVSHVKFVPHGYLIYSIPWIPAMGLYPPDPWVTISQTRQKPIPRAVGMGNPCTSLWTMVCSIYYNSKR